MSLHEITRRAIQALDTNDVDQAACELALIYARHIDAAVYTDKHVVVRDLGPKLHALLADLLMTPKSRAAIERQMKEAADDNDSAATVLSELRGD